MLLFLWILLFESQLEITESQSYENVTNLQTTLLTSYNPNVLPLNDHADVLNINLTAIIFKMPEVDPVYGSLTMAIMLNVEWYDERLTWIPADHGGINNISIKSSEVWTPPLALSNAVEFTLLGQPWMQAMFMSDGKASYGVASIIEFYCVFHMKFWPFDKHVCSFILFPYGQARTRVAFTKRGSVVNTDMYEMNGEWYLDETSFKYETGTSFGMSLAIYSFRIARQPSFYMVTVIIPINGIGALISLVFLLPSESGERVGYSITIMLSLAVFLSVISTDLPRNSEPIPIMFVFILFNMLVCICAVFLVILNLALYHRNENVQISELYKALVRLSRRMCGQRKVLDWRIKAQKDPANPNNRNNSISKLNGETNVIKVLPQDVMSDDSDEARDIVENITWKDVSKAIDKLLFYTMFLLTYIPSLIILIYIAVAADYVTQ